MKTNNKLREVVELVAHMNDDGYWNSSAQICDLVELALAALAEPMKNCDVGTPREQADRAFAFCLGRGCKECEFMKLTFRECTLAWAQMPYEKEALDKEGEPKEQGGGGEDAD